MLRKPKTSERIIDLDGVDGNAYVLLNRASYLAKQLDLNPDKITDEMMSGDYVHLVKTFDKYFGEFVILETTQEELLNN